MAAAELSAHLGALLAACARRDQRSLAELYKLTSPQLFGVLLDRYLVQSDGETVSRRVPSDLPDQLLYEASHGVGEESGPCTLQRVEDGRRIRPTSRWRRRSHPAQNALLKPIR